MRKIRSDIFVPVAVFMAIIFVGWQIMTASAQVRVNPTKPTDPSYSTITATTANLTSVIGTSGYFPFLSVGHMTLTGMMSATAVHITSGTFLSVAGDTANFTTVIATSATLQSMIATTISLGGTALSAWPAGSDLTNPGPIGGGTPSTGAFTSLSANTATFIGMIGTSSVFTNVLATSVTFNNVRATSVNSSGFIGIGGVSVVKSNDKGHPIWMGTTDGSATAYTANNISGFTLEQLSPGATFVGIIHTSNTGTSPTLNVNGTGAKTIKRFGTENGATIQAGDLGTGTAHQFVYDGTDYRILNLDQIQSTSAQVTFLSSTFCPNSGAPTVGTVTGIGFQPSSAYVTVTNGTTGAVTGYWSRPIGGAGYGALSLGASSIWSSPGLGNIGNLHDGTNTCNIALSSTNPDGVNFTFTRTVGTPAGTMTLTILAFK